jgi:hypothetical protein
VALIDVTVGDCSVMVGVIRLTSGESAWDYAKSDYELVSTIISLLCRSSAIQNFGGRISPDQCLHENE